jgi:predicted lipid-binding transport protein (Tim44 family)
MKSNEIEKYIYKTDIELYEKVYQTIQKEYDSLDIKTIIDLVDIMDNLKKSIRVQIREEKKKEMYHSKK